MLNDGIYELGDFIITGAGEFTGTPIEDLDGLLAIAVSLRFSYGSAGTSVNFYLQTSFDQGQTWADVACMACTTASKHRMFSLDALTSVGLTSPGNGALADDTVLNGLLGNMFRIKYVVVGTYAGSTTMSARLHAR